jgi:hypothetical protein
MMSSGVEAAIVDEHKVIEAVTNDDRIAVAVVVRYRKIFAVAEDNLGH